MNKLVRLARWPEKLPCDKRMHWIIGSVFTAILLCMPLSVVTIVVALVGLAWGIEVSQKVFKWGTYDNWDAVAVVIGGLVVILPYILKG